MTADARETLLEVGRILLRWAGIVAVALVAVPAGSALFDLLLGWAMADL